MNKIKTYEDFINEEINLKKTIAGAALGAGLALGGPVKGQVSTTNVIKPEYKNTQYDSTSNDIRTDWTSLSKSKSEVSKLVGQTLYLKPLDFMNVKSSYLFAKKYPEQESGGPGSTMKLTSFDFYTKLSGIDGYDGKYDIKTKHKEDTLLHGKYFFVDSILVRESEINYDSGDIFLKLKETESGKIYYCEYKFNKGDRIESFPFIVMGFYDKQLKLLTGSELVVSGVGSCKLIKGGKIIRKDLTDYNFRKIDAPAGVFDESTHPEFNKIGYKYKFTGLIVDVNQMESPLCLVFEDGSDKIIIPWNKAFETKDKGTGISYPSSYYSMNINVTFNITVNIYRY